MERIALDDDRVAGIGYNEKSRILEVAYHNGMIRRYNRVPSVIYQGFWRAPHKDLYIARYVHGIYGWSYVSQEEDAKETCERLRGMIARRDAAIDCLVDGIEEAMKSAMAIEDGREIAIGLMNCVRDCRLSNQVNEQVRQWIEALEEDE